MVLNTDNLPPQSNIFFIIGSYLDKISFSYNNDVIQRLSRELTFMDEICNLILPDYIANSDIEKKIVDRIISIEYKLFNHYLLPLKIAVGKNGLVNYFIEEREHDEVQYSNLIHYGKSHTKLFLPIKYRHNLDLYELDMLLQQLDNVIFKDILTYLNIIDSYFSRNPEAIFHFNENIVEEFTKYNHELKKNQKPTTVEISTEFISKMEYSEFELGKFLGKFLVGNHSIKDIRILDFRKGSVIINLEIDTNDVESVILSLRNSGIFSSNLLKFDISNKKDDYKNNNTNHNMKFYKRKAKTLISEDMEKGIAYCEEIFKNCAPNLENEFFAIKGRYSLIMEDKNNGTEDTANLRIELNKILISLYSIIDRIEEINVETNSFLVDMLD